MHADTNGVANGPNPTPRDMPARQGSNREGAAATRQENARIEGRNMVRVDGAVDRATGDIPEDPDIADARRIELQREDHHQRE